MALTKISTGGVKDDAASQAKIADEAVDEARLQVSNAGTNGQFLSKQSGNTGGLTWANVPTQYTHPNHSGEVTSTGDGATVIASNTVDEDNLKVSNSPTNGQFLQAQSGASGGLTWANVTIPPAGNTIDLVADGAIAAGKPVILTTAGKVKAVQTTVSHNSGDTAIASEITLGGNLSGTSDSRETHTHYVNDGSNEWFFVWNKTNSGQNSYVQLFKKESGTWTYKTETLIGGVDNTSNDKRRMAIAWDSTNNRILLLYIPEGSNNEIRYRVGEITNTSTGAITFANEATAVSGHSNNGGIALDFEATTGRFMLAYRGWSGDPYIKIGNISNTSTNAMTWGSGVDPSSGGGADQTRLGVTSIGSSKGVLTWSQGGDIYAALFTVSNSANSVTLQTAISYDATGSYSYEYPVIVWDPEYSKVVIMFRDNGDSGRLKAIHSAVSGTTLAAFGTHCVVHSYDNTHNQYWLGYNTYSGGLYALFIFDENVGYFRISTIDASNSTISSSPANGTDGYGNHINNLRQSGSNDQYGRFARGTMDQANGDIIFAGSNRGSSGSASNGIRVERINTANPSSNLDSNGRNFLGFAEDAISDGNTGTIKLRGNVVGGQSGLTIGTYYDIQNDGTLTANWASNSVGLRAIAADKGQIVANNGT